MDTKHVILFIAGLLLAISKYVAANVPQYAPYANLVESGLALLMGYLGVTSPKMSFGPKPPQAPPSSKTGFEYTPTIKSKPPEPPAAARKETLHFPRGLVLGVLLLAIVFAPSRSHRPRASFAVGLQGCTAAQWQTFVTDAQHFIAYVQAFLAGIQSLWAVIVQVIPAAQQTSAVAAFNDASLGVTTALSELEDAIQIGTATQTAPGNYPQLMAAVQDAVAQLVNLVNKWQPLTTTPHASVAAAELGQSARTIAAWRPR